MMNPDVRPQIADCQLQFQPLSKIRYRCHLWTKCLKITRTQILKLRIMHKHPTSVSLICNIFSQKKLKRIIKTASWKNYDWNLECSSWFDLKMKNSEEFFHYFSDCLCIKILFKALKKSSFCFTSQFFISEKFFDSAVQSLLTVLC